MTAYYNEFEPFAAAWLRELIADGLIAKGDVDERSILDVPADDLRGYRQVHFFAGIGGWSRALRLAGWPDDREVWTGSCPCQPLSSAGQQKGHEDERHIWPAFHDLIAVCQPATVFGEQVASKLGREWLAGVRADLESSGYAVGAADLPAASVGAPHIRQRLWWVADASNYGRDGRFKKFGRERQKDQQEQRLGVWREFGGHGEDGGVADADGGRSDGWRKPDEGGLQTLQGSGSGDSSGPSSTDFWDGEYIPCADGKARRTQPGIFPLAHGIPNRVGTLRGAGNAIVPQVASVFVTAFMESKQ